MHFSSRHRSFTRLSPLARSDLPYTDSSDATSTRRRDLWFALVAVIGFQMIATVRLRNDAFVDEATYIMAGRTMLGRLAQGDWSAVPYASYFSGAPYLQPSLAAFFDGFGGLEMARGFSLVCLLLATLAMAAGVARQLGRPAAIGAALAFVTQGTVQFVGHLATPDAPALLALAVGLGIAFSATPRYAMSAAIGVGVCAALAGATKYGALAYAPVIALVLVVRLWLADDRQRAVIALLLSAVTGAGVLWVVLRLDGGTLFDAVWFTTLERPFSQGYPAAVVWGKVLEYGGMMLAMIVYGMVQGRLHWALIGVLLLGVLVAPVQHVRLGELVSLHKHVAFSALFAAPIAGIALVRLYEGLGNAIRYRGRDSRSVLGALAVGSAMFLIVAPGIAQAGALYGAWPEETGKVYRDAVRGLAPSARVLTEEEDLGSYYGSMIGPVQWSGRFGTYRRQDGTEVVGDSAATYALYDAAFDRVVLRFDRTHTWSREIDLLLKADPRYVVRETVRYRLPGEDGAFIVWEKRTMP